MVPLPGSWSSCTHSISHTWPPFFRVDFREILLEAVVLHEFLPCHLGPLWPPPFINLCITCSSDCTTRTLHTSKWVKPSLSKNEVNVLKLKFFKYLAWSYTVVATNSGLIMQICLIMALSLRCRFILVNDNVWVGMVLHARAVHLVKGGWGCENWYIVASYTSSRQ